MNDYFKISRKSVPFLSTIEKNRATIAPIALHNGCGIAKVEDGDSFLVGRNCL